MEAKPFSIFRDTFSHWMIDTYFDMMDLDRDLKLSSAELKNGFVGLRYVTLKIMKGAAALSNH